MTKKILIGNVAVGGGESVKIQSMTTADTADAQKTAEQIKLLEKEGCEIVRASVYDMRAAEAFREIKQQISIPLVADVHFDYRLAIAAAENGADKVRINPGNITSEEGIRSLVACMKAHKLPIRIGVNAGSLSKEVEERFGGATPEALAASALENIAMLEKLGFFDIVVSVKASDVRKMISAYRLLSKQCDYPLHLGVTEAGGIDVGTVKNAIGIGALLLDGIGDTIRVSLTGDPVNEVRAAKNILRSLGMYNKGVEIISCPMCARTRIPLEKIAEDVRQTVKDIEKPLKVAVMGCVVNGPGEAKDADIGIAGGGDGTTAAVFKNGELLCTGELESMVKLLVDEIKKMADT